MANKVSIADRLRMFEAMKAASHVYSKERNLAGVKKEIVLEHKRHSVTEEDIVIQSHDLTKKSQSANAAQLKQIRVRAAEPEKKVTAPQLKQIRVHAAEPEKKTAAPQLKQIRVHAAEPEKKVTVPQLKQIRVHAAEPEKKSAAPQLKQIRVHTAEPEKIKHQIPPTAEELWASIESQLADTKLSKKDLINMQNIECPDCTGELFYLSKPPQFCTFCRSKLL